MPADALPADYRQEAMATPRTGSFIHLHLGIDATDLPADLECHHLVANRWGDFEVGATLCGCLSVASGHGSGEGKGGGGGYHSVWVDMCSEQAGFRREKR
jgi:hypothetical protein